MSSVRMRWIALRFFCSANFNHMNQEESLCEFVSVLLQLRKEDVDVNQQDKWGNNVLIYLCAKCKGEWILKLVQLLLDHGAVINQENKCGYDALMCLFSKRLPTN